MDKSIRVYGADECKDTQRTRRHLDEVGAAHEYINVDQDAGAEEQVKRWNQGKRKTPTLVVRGNAGERILPVPSDGALDAELDRQGLLPHAHAGDGSPALGQPAEMREHTHVRGVADAGELGFSTRVEAAYEAAIEQTKSALKEQGFGVLSEIRIHEALREKLGVEVPKQTILGACNPQLAHAALELEPDLALLLPCNVVVSEREGRVQVSAVNAEQMLQVVGRDELRSIAEDANRRLRAAIESLRARKAA